MLSVLRGTMAPFWRIPRFEFEADLAIKRETAACKAKFLG